MTCRQSTKKVFFQGFSEREHVFSHGQGKLILCLSHAQVQKNAACLPWLLSSRFCMAGDVVCQGTCKCPVLQFWVLPGDPNMFQTAKCMHTPELVLFLHRSTAGKIKNHKHFQSLEVAEALTEINLSLQASIHNLPQMVSTGPTSLCPRANWFALPVSLTPQLLLPFRNLQGCL